MHAPTELDTDAVGSTCICPTGFLSFKAFPKTSLQVRLNQSMTGTYNRQEPERLMILYLCNFSNTNKIQIQHLYIHLST